VAAFSGEGTTGVAVTAMEGGGCGNEDGGREGKKIRVKVLVV